MINESRSCSENEREQFNGSIVGVTENHPKGKQGRQFLERRLFMMFLFRIRQEHQTRKKRGFVCAFAMLLYSFKFIVCTSLVHRNVPLELI